MTAVEVSERCDELTDGMEGSVDAVTRAVVDQSWDPGLVLLKAWMTLLAFSLGLLVMFSARSSSAQNQPAAPPTVDVTGVWVVAWTYGNEGGTLTLHLQQTGSRVIGNAAVGGGYPVASGVIEGTVIANQLSYRRTGVDLKVELPYGADLTVNGDEMSGYSTGGSRLKLQRQE